MAYRVYLPLLLLLMCLGTLIWAKDEISLILLGEDDSGRLNVGGHLVVKLGSADPATVAELTKKADEAGIAPSEKYEWILKQLPTDPRLNTWKIETSTATLNLMDRSNHQNFVRDLLTGIISSNSALLVVSAAPGEMEAATATDSQTRAHISLAYTVGVKQMIVAVNKMDKTEPSYSEKRFNGVKEEVSKILKSSGFDTDTVLFVPVSGAQGDNMETASSNMPWYKKDVTVKKTLDLVKKTQLSDLPLRVPFQDVYKIGGVGTVPVGRVETGIMTPGMRVTIAPVQITTTVKSVEMHHESLQQAFPGSTVGFNLKSVSIKELKRGYVAGDAGRDPPKGAKEFIAQLIVIDHPGEIKVDYAPVFDIHTAHVGCKFAELLAKIDGQTGKKLKDNPSSLKTGDVAIVKLIPAKPLSVEPFRDYPALGRFAVRDFRKTVAIGIIQSVVHENVNGKDVKA